ncbi:MAG: alpha/beta hydrolase [Myxococcales bacterium]|nr:alpha/beta hydrolase [Myxococcales bacterium]
MRRLARVVIGFFAALGVGYVGILALVFFGQRVLLFPAPRTALPLSAASQLVELERTVLLVRPAVSPGSPVVLHFHGNGEQLASLEWMAEAWAEQGVGFVAVEYPGYGLAKSKGTPSEASILTAADEALNHVQLTMGISADRLIVSGQSLGSGVAVALAHRGIGRKLVLFTPYTSLPDVGARVMPFLPVRRLMRDRFDSGAKAVDVKQPVLIIHGTDDEVVPFDLGERLSKTFPNATLLRIDGGHHNDVAGREAVWAALVPFVFAR